MSQAPIPSNMEGQRGNPYAWYRTAFNPRLMASGAMMGLLPPGVGAADRLTGSNIRNFADRLSGAELARNQQDTNAYMRQLMRDDPGYEQYSVGQRLRNWARGLFGGGDEGEGMGPAPLPATPSSRPYSAPTFQGNPYGGGANQMGGFQFQQFLPSMAPQPLYGSGQGMMRAQPAPLYGTGQGMMRAPDSGGAAGGGGGGASGGGGGGATGGGGGGGGSGGLSPGQRLLSMGWATRLK